MNAEAIHRVLKHGSAADRLALVRSLPRGPFTDVALSVVASDRPGMVVVALGPSAIGYCSGAAPEIGAELAWALHAYAVDLFEGTPDHGLIPTTLSGLADSFVRACNLLGRSTDVLTFTDRYVPFYERIRETANLPSLKLGRVAALLNLNRLEEAAQELDDPTLPGNPATDIELERLRGRLRILLQELTGDAAKPASVPLGEDAIARAVATLGTLTAGSPEQDAVKRLADRLAGAPRADPNDPAGFATLLEVLREGEQFLRQGGAEESDLTIGRRIREASGLFVLEKRPPPERIRASLAELERCLAWADARSVVELQNDALYGIYLCRGRLGEPSAAADALLRLRGNLEATRSSITDVIKRGGAFSAYPHLFPALCQTLHAAGRFDEMLEAIDASKGRGVADLLTARAGQPVADVRINAAVAEVPELCRQYGFHYLSYLVDEEQTYAVLVTRAGRVHAPPPMPLSRDAIRQAASPVTPDVAERLSPLVAWLEPLLEDGSIAPGEHLCVAADDDLVNVPFSMLPLRHGPLAETLSTSRIHNAYHLTHVLDADPRLPERYLGLAVPTRQNAASESWAAMRADLLKPIHVLMEGRPGETLEGIGTTVDALAARKLDHSVVHFSTHGMFPTTGSPFERSGLILAAEDALPDAKAVDLRTVLTPSRILDRKLDLTGSHVSMMACVSGLAREAVGGDALGMEWAMIQAGAASVLSSHWNVSARLAGAFLATFYERWLRPKESRAGALSATIAALRAGGGRAGQPASWAAFSLTGDWR